MASKTEAALALIEQGRSVRAAAREVDVSEAAVHAALKKQRAKEQGVCPCCGQPLPERKLSKT